APAPVLARLGRADDRMAGRGMVGGRVPAGRVVAAADVPALLAHAQVDPLHALREALLATGDLSRGVEVPDRLEMGAGRSRAITLARRSAASARVGRWETSNRAARRSLRLASPPCGRKSSSSKDRRAPRWRPESKSRASSATSRRT